MENWPKSKASNKTPASLLLPRHNRILSGFGDTQTRILTTVFAGILISDPVAGLLPRRDFLLTRTISSIPGRVKNPASLVSETTNAATSSMISAAVFLDISNFAAKWETI
jgi:hypothetical protein